MMSVADLDAEDPNEEQMKKNKQSKITKVPTSVMALLNQARSETFKEKNRGLSKRVLKQQLEDDR